MRIAVCSDLHGNLEAVRELWNSFHDIDRIYCLGDLVGIGPDPRKVMEIVLDDKRFSWVMGNHDINTRDGTELGPLQYVPRKPHHQWVRKEIDDLVVELDAPMSISLNESKTRIVLMHRHPDDCGSKVPYFDRPYPEVLDDFYSDVPGEILMFGHTHIPLMVVGNRGRIYVNPGSVGAENGGLATYLVFDNDQGALSGMTLRKVRYDPEPVKKKLKRKEVPYHRFIIEHFFEGVSWAPSTVKDI
jgi:putative phosphoesterase